MSAGNLTNEFYQAGLKDVEGDVSLAQDLAVSTKGGAVRTPLAAIPR